MVLAMTAAVMVSPVSAQQRESADVSAEVVASDLDAPTDFSVAKGAVVFIAEQGAQQIRRVQDDNDEIVVSGIASDDQPPESIAVHAISSKQILIGVSGFSSSAQSLRLFDVSTETLPLDFNNQHVKHSKTYQRSMRQADELGVLRIFKQQKGLSIVIQSVEANPSLYDICFKAGNLERIDPILVDTTVDLSTVTVDQMGGYLAAMAQDEPKRIVFFQADGTFMQSFSIDLENIVSLCFSPKHNRLYALVGNSKNVPGDSGGDGIYEILTNGDACKSRFIIGVARPQKLKFDTDGNAWVLCRSDAQSSLGLLKKIKNLDVPPASTHSKEEPKNED